MALVSCQQLGVGYRGHTLLPPISMEIEPGDFWAVIGRNGSGKSTWFKTLLGLLPPVSGDLKRKPGLLPGYVPQRSAFDELYPLTGRQVAAQGLFRGWSFWRFWEGQEAEIARALKEVGADGFAHRPFRSLSEGQKQRVLLARLILGRSEVAFLDEPTAAMDAVAEEEALGQVERIRREHRTAVVVVSHNLEVARKYANKVLYLDRDLVVVGSVDEIFAHAAFRQRYGLDAG